MEKVEPQDLEAGRGSGLARQGERTKSHSTQQALVDGD